MTLIESDALFVTYPARAGAIEMAMPGVVGPVFAPAELPAPLFFEHPSQPDSCDAIAMPSARAASETEETRSRRKRYNSNVTGETENRSRAFAVALIALALICSTRAAYANGRFPQAQVIESIPGSDGSTLFLRATFGVLVSRDTGKTWHWICERALGYDGQWDPPIAVTRDGRLWIGLERGLVSTLDGCTLETTNELAGEQVKDLTTDPKGETVWVLTGAPDRRGAVWRRSSLDAGSKWERMGLLPEGIHPMTIEVAPSKPSRIYVSGQPYGTVRGGLFRSDDSGKTFTGEKNELAHTGPFFIAAVDPKDPNRILLRHLHSTGSTVFVSSDGGKTLKEVLAMDSAMFGFAKSPDGLTYWAASGLAKDGILRSTDRGEHFELVSNHGVLCLHAAPNGSLFICENPFTLGAPGIAVSPDQGKTVSTLAGFSDVKGPITCDAGAGPDAAAGLCADAWPETLASFLPSDAGARRARDGGTRGTRNNSRRDAGTQPDAPARKSTCGCTVVGASESSPDRAWLTAGLLPLALWARARRRRGSPLDQSGRGGTR